MAILAAFNIANRAAREHLGHYDDPMPLEVRYDGNLLNIEETLEKNKIKQLESIIEMDSVLGNKPGRSNRLGEFHAKRARKELKQIRVKQKESANK